MTSNRGWLDRSYGEDVGASTHIAAVRGLDTSDTPDVVVNSKVRHGFIRWDDERVCVTAPFPWSGHGAVTMQISEHLLELVGA